jgi:hypothetical protein
VGGRGGGATWEEGLVGEEVHYEGHVDGVVGACAERA